MEEPSLKVIKEISGNDAEFEKNLLEIIRKEFKKEVESYTNNFRKKDFEEAADSVHKLKHKISLMGLEEGLKNAALYEKEIKEGKIELHENFVDTLHKINVYLYN